MLKESEILKAMANDKAAAYEALRKFSTSELLKKINRVSVDLFKNPSVQSKAAKEVRYKIKKSRTFIFEHKSSIRAWDLIDLTYHSVMASNDFRGDGTLSEDDLYALSDIVYHCLSNKEERFDNMYPKEEAFNKLLINMSGFCGEQFKFQQYKKPVQNACRELYILFEFSDTESYNIAEIVFEEVGVTWKKILFILFVTWERFKTTDSLSFDDSFFANLSEDSKNEFKLVIDRYTADYKEIRDSKLTRQIFYTKPYVKTQNNEIISVNTYLNMFLCEHCILWIVRDYFNRNKNSNFIAYFGVLFEGYFNELLSECLAKSEYEKLNEEETERADWKIEVEGYKFLIEQKSSIARISIKQQQTSINDIEEFAKKTIIKAISQLHSTETEINNGKFIKIILLYDEYIDANFLESFFCIPECKVENDGYYWMAKIEEMEKLFWLCKYNRELFKEIVKEMINKQTIGFNEGRSIAQILNEKKILSNEYIQQEKIISYLDVVKKVGLEIFK